MTTACLSTDNSCQSLSRPRSMNDDAKLIGKRRDHHGARARRLLGVEIEFIDNTCFHERDAKHRILDGDCLARDEEIRSSNAEMPPPGMPAYLARLCEAELLTPERERKLFRRMNYLKFRANALRAGLDPDDPNVDALDQAGEFLSEAIRIRDEIVRSNMRLVVSIVKKFVTSHISFDDLLSDGTLTLIKAVDKFDYGRGFRFSTYAYRSIVRSVYRSIDDHQKDNKRFVCGSDEAVDPAIENVDTAIDEQTWTALNRKLTKMLHRLDRREHYIISRRFALGKHRKIHTFQSIADKLGLSKERVRQLEQRAVAKLQMMAAEV